jgi:hypothetical protein
LLRRHMSPFGTNRTYEDACCLAAFGGKADIGRDCSRIYKSAKNVPRITDAIGANRPYSEKIFAKIFGHNSRDAVVREPMGPHVYLGAGGVGSRKLFRSVKPGVLRCRFGTLETNTSVLFDHLTNIR